MRQPIVLRIYKDDKLEAVRQFQHSQIVIGRNADVQLELNDESVALLHAMIEDRDGEYFISDLGSQSGTFKNGQRLLEDVLNSGDELKIGPFRIQFYVGVPKPAAPPKPFVAPAAPTAPPAAVNFSMPLPEHPPDVEESTMATPPPTKSTDKKKKSFVGKSSKNKTFAPPSPYKSLNEIIKPHKGTVLEVIVAWRDRVLSSNHFNRQGSVFISSSEEADVVVPILSSKSRYQLIKIQSAVTICLTTEMTGEMIRDGQSVTFSELSRQHKLRNVGTHFEYDIHQGEMVRIGLQGDLISIYIRFVSDTPKPLVAPLLDMSSSEVTGVTLAMAISAIMWLYMNIYTPSPLLEDEAKIEEPIRKAVVQFTPPKPKEKQVVMIEDKPQEKKVSVVKEQPKQVRQTPKPSVEKKGDPGKAGEVAPKPDSKNLPKKLTSARSGGAIKTAPKEGANMKSQRPDPTKVGLLGVFSTKGTQSKLDQAYSGSGELQGMADAATGYAGQAENRAGNNIGSKLKDVGAGGKGSATIGIAGVGTQGRGTGTTGYGTGGIGQKGSVQINVGGQDAEIPGTMDREAIRRVIREHIREIRNCYERELQRSPDLYGKLVLEWDIEEAGRVSRVAVKSNELGNKSVAQCIMSHLKTWKFPDPPKDQIGRVVYPFVFSSQ